MTALAAVYDLVANFVADRILDLLAPVGRLWAWWEGT